jgi:hypothetical protein
MNANIIVQDQSPLLRFLLIDAVNKQMTDGYDEKGMRRNNRLDKQVLKNDLKLPIRLHNGFSQCG